MSGTKFHPILTFVRQGQLQAMTPEQAEQAARFNLDMAHVVREATKSRWLCDFDSHGQRFTWGGKASDQTEAEDRARHELAGQEGFDRAQARLTAIVRVDHG